MPRYTLSSLLNKTPEELKQYCAPLYKNLLDGNANMDKDLCIALEGIRINKYLFEDPKGAIAFDDFVFMIILMTNGFRNNGFSIVRGRFTVIFD